MTVRALACKWLQHFGDRIQRAKTEDTYTAIFKVKERARQTLALPFDPGLDAVDGKSVDSIIAFDAYWIHDDSIRVAQSHMRKDNGTTDYTRVERTIDEALTY